MHMQSLEFTRENGKKKQLLILNRPRIAFSIFHFREFLEISRFFESCLLRKNLKNRLREYFFLLFLILKFI